MKAIAQDRYGSPDVLTLADVPDPVPGPDDVLVRVRAASVNAADWHVMRGDPLLARLTLGLRRPKARIRGCDYAGVIEAVGDRVAGPRPGDEVYGQLGLAGGAFAELVCVAGDLVDTKPASLTFEEAATVPLAGGTALMGLRDAGQVRSGHQVLINGSSGGVGTFAVQIGKALGAEVTAVCSTRNVDLARSLGADHVVDYTTEDFTRSGRGYDVVLDLVGNRSLSELRSVLTPTGTVVLSGGGVFTGGSLVGPMGLFIKARLVSRFVSHRVVDLDAVPDREVLVALRELIEAGKIRPVVDRTYPLVDVPEAIRVLETEHARAKMAITI